MKQYRVAQVRFGINGNQTRVAREDKQGRSVSYVLYTPTPASAKRLATVLAGKPAMFYTDWVTVWLNQ